MKEIHYASGNYYVGEIKDGKRHGKGTFYFSNGFKYEGEFKNGVIEGQGTFYYDDGNIYNGEFVNNIRQGKGTMNYSNGDKYEGNWLEGKKSGKGIYTFANGDIYDGTFESGNQNGKGILKKSNGYTYEGEFVENKAHGEGSCLFTDGTTFVGKFSSDNIISGKYTLIDGTIIEGEFVNQNKSGNGTITYPDGSYYIGAFKNQLKDGEGKLYHTTGAIESGVWQNNFLIQKAEVNINKTTIKAVVDLTENANSETILDNFVSPEDDMHNLDLGDQPLNSQVEKSEEKTNVENEDDDILEGIIIRNKTSKNSAEETDNNFNTLEKINENKDIKNTPEKTEIDSEISAVENSIIDSIINEEINSIAESTEAETNKIDVSQENLTTNQSTSEESISQTENAKQITEKSNQVKIECLQTENAEDPNYKEKNANDSSLEQYDIYTDIYADDEWSKKDIMSYNFDSQNETKTTTTNDKKDNKINEDKKENKNEIKDTYENAEVTKTDDVVLEEDIYISQNPSDIYEKAKENKNDPELEYFLYYTSAIHGHLKSIKKLKSDRKYANLYYAKYLSKVLNNHKDIFKAYINASNYGNVSAQYFVATQYVLGIGTKQNLKKALKWYKKVLKNKDINATKYKLTAENNINLIKTYLSDKNKTAVLDLNSLTVKIIDTENVKAKSGEIITIER